MSQPPVQNEPSLLLTPEENEMVFAALGARRITKATAVAQVYHANPDPSKWTKYKTGVVCFVKDNLRKSYYIRLLEMNGKGTCTLVWEQELYNQFTYTKDFPHFHHFPGDKFMVGLNFSDDKEADKFLKAMETKIKDRQQRRQTLKQRKDNSFTRTTSPPNIPAPSLPPPNTSHSHQLPTPPRSSPLTSIPETTSHNTPVQSSSNKGQQKGKRKKISKSDISAPSNFQHLAHVGWDPNTGAFDSNNIDAAWKKLFDTVGVSDTDLKDENTAKFIYDFVEKHGGIEKANQQLEAEKQKAPPPPPSHSNRGRSGQAPPPPPPHASRGAPPPPNRNAPPPPPSHGHGHHHAAPPPPSRSAPPPPPSRHGNVPAPPPPPPVNVPAPPPPPPISSGGPPISSGGPPISSGGPPPPPAQSNKSSNLPMVSDARANLMESIRAGKTLHKVEEQAPAEKKPPASDGIAGALARALASRKDVIADSDSSDDEEYDEDEDDWSD